MEAFSELLGFVSAIGDEISNIIIGDGDEVEVQEEEPIRPIVLAGPSGVGKGTLIEKLMKEFPDHFGFSISHTTRQPRAGESNGVHYHFTDRATMAAMIEAGDFLESADVHGNYYGTSKAAIASVRALNKICILDIDVQGVQQVKKAALEPAPIFMFINPPSLEELESRLRGRGTETEDKIQKRLSAARTEMDYAAAEDGDNFDHVFVNDDLAKCYEALTTYIGPNLDAVTRETAKANAPKTTPKEVTDTPTTAAVVAPPTEPSVADQIKAKELELDAANAVKDRTKAAQLLAELTTLEAKLEAV